MKKNVSLFTTILLGFCTICCFAQETALKVNNKMGKPTTEEFNLTIYEPEPEAEAVVLYDETDADYRWGIDDFRINYSRKTRIKVLKEEGIDYANVTLMLFENSTNRSRKEAISGLKAFAYNVENGKVVKTKMDKDQIFRERINDNYVQLKFTIPQVKVGTIIEYEYDLISDFYYQLESWDAQWKIPVLYTEYEIGIPEFFLFDVDVKGSHILKREDKAINMNFTAYGDILSCSGNNIKLIGEQIPSIKPDKFIWCIDNYRTLVDFELRGIEIPGAVYRYFTQTWDDIDAALLEDEDFGGRLKMNNPFKEEMKLLPLNETTEIEEKICMIHELLQSKLKWNEKYALGGRNARQILKDGTGSNADLNFIFISMLKDAGITATPAIMSRRDMPMLPNFYPSLEKLNTFVVAIANSDSTLIFYDSSNRYGYLNSLPEILLTDRARVLGYPNLWINLKQIGNNTIKTSITAQITPEGKIIANRVGSFSGLHAAKIRESYLTAEDSLAYIQAFKESIGMEIKKYQIEGVNDYTPNIQEHMDFEIDCEMNGNLMYINPLIFTHVDESPFTQTERKLPIEFPHTDQINLLVTYTLPEGYVVDELPKSTRIETTDKELYAYYYVAQNNNQIIIRYNFKQSKLLFTPNQYAELKHFWELLADLNNSRIVIKKL